jgi:hypothetical protein
MSVLIDNKKNQENKIKFCVCAMVDLLGFSNHLEISGYDLRTSIGQQAINRLENLEKVLLQLSSEKSTRIEYYPENFHVQRINDAIFFSMDLDEALTPEVGQTFFQGVLSDKLFPETQKETWEEYQSANSLKMNQLLEPLMKFMGLISRVHLSINKLEGENFFPGAKTVICSGYRKSFHSIKGDEDYFSANFAMANTYSAEKLLHGANLYIDSSLLQLISYNKFAKNLLQFGHFQFKNASFDCFDNHENVFNLKAESIIPKPIELKLFRKDYQFSLLNPAPLTFLQNLPAINKYLCEELKADLTNIYYKHIYNLLRKGINGSKKKDIKAPPSFIFNGTNDLTNDIGILYEFLSTGKSKTRLELKEKKFQEENKNVSAKGKKEIRKLMDQTVEIELIKIKIEDCKESLYELNEETLTTLIEFILEGNIEQLDYKDPNNIS